MPYIIYVILCHILGWIMTGYFVIRLLSKKDIRFEGSRNIGAQNSGRIAGAGGFILTFLGDAIKGGVAVAMGLCLNYPNWILLLGLIAVIAGHIWPWPFRFKGGKGVSSFVGGILVYNPESTLILVLGTGLFYLILKNFTIAGLGAILLWPVYDSIILKNSGTFVLEILLVLTISWAHRNNIKSFITIKGGKVKKWP